MLDILSKKHIVAKEGFNRWLIAPAALGIHLCIGSVYAWSLFNPALIKSLGVVVSSSQDWVLSEVVWIFSVSIVFLGLAAAFAGKWLEDVGPRLVGFVAACLWGLLCCVVRAIPALRQWARPSPSGCEFLLVVNAFGLSVLLRVSLLPP